VFSLNSLVLPAKDETQNPGSTSSELGTKFKTLDVRTGRWLGLVLGICYFAFASLGGEGRARPLGVSVGVVFALGYIAWEFRRKQSFWLLMVGIAAVHLMVTVLVPWQNSRLPGFLLVPIFLADFCVWFSLVYFVLKRT